MKAPDIPTEPDASCLGAPHPGLADAELSVAETVGRLMHFWGFKRPMGRLWTVLYLSPAPLTAPELAERLAMSAGGVSMALAELERWGAVRRTSQAGTRREFFEAEPDIWKMVRRVLQERELALVSEFRETLRAAESAVDSARAPEASGPRSKRPARDTAQIGSPEATQSNRDQEGDLEYKRDRLRTLADLARTGEGLLGALCAGHLIDPSALSSHPAGEKSNQ